MLGSVPVFIGSLAAGAAAAHRLHPAGRPRRRPRSRSNCRRAARWRRPRPRPSRRARDHDPEPEVKQRATASIGGGAPAAMPLPGRGAEAPSARDADAEHHAAATNAAACASRPSRASCARQLAMLPGARFNVGLRRHAARSMQLVLQGEDPAALLASSRSGGARAAQPSPASGNVQSSASAWCGRR